MKVCTDATLFGAMAPIAGGEQVLDIGSGSGLLSLMAMQLGAGNVTAVEVTEEACRDATVNFSNSPWTDQMRLINESVQTYSTQSATRYDLIISNPPFFENHSKNASSLRQVARHTDLLPFDELIQVVSARLKTSGLCYLLIPVSAVARVIELAGQRGLTLIRRVDYAGFRGSPAKVAALTFRLNADRFVYRRLVIYNAPRSYTEESAQYLKSFLLRFADGHATAD